MFVSVEQFRNRSLLAAFGISTIKLYQNTYSKVTPPRCRFVPSCSQYGIEAIETYGLIEGIKLTRSRISRCHRPNGGYDPVPKENVYFAAKKKLDSKAIKNAGFKVIQNLVPGEIVVNYQYPFRLILAYPKNKEFLSQADFQQKIAEVNKYIFQNYNFALQYKIAKIEIGTIKDYYLIRISGSIPEEYKETYIEQVIDLIIIQLAAFFLVTQEREFEAIYFEVDGQILIKPKSKTKAIPQNYTGQDNFWNYTSNPNIWDIYWGDFTVDIFFSLIDTLSDIDTIYLSGEDDGGCSFDGWDGFDGWNDNTNGGCISDGWDGCGGNSDYSGNDGCDGGDGCDGCDGCVGGDGCG